MSLATLQVIWFLLVMVLLTGYALLAGTDLGVGNLHLLTKPGQREANFNAVGPFWDSNQVWLVTFGGALFAAFPMAYATVFSGFYLALMLVLLAIIIRSVAIEFHHQLASRRWRKTWDLSFASGSILLSFLYGVAMGNLFRGLPLDETYSFAGTFFGLLNPYALTVGLFSLAMFTLHGAAFLIARLDGAVAVKARLWAQQTCGILSLLFVGLTVWSYLEAPRLFVNFLTHPALLLIPLAGIGACIYFPYALKSKERWRPLIISAVMVASFLGIAGASLFPYLVPAFSGPGAGLTIFNASSSQQTLFRILIVALTGCPLVIFYTVYVYRKFKREG